MKKKNGAIINSGKIPTRKYISKTIPPLSIIEIILAKRTADHISIKKLIYTIFLDRKY